MEKFDFGTPAELFVVSGRGAARQKMGYQRFPTGADAIRYAVEVVGVSGVNTTLGMTAIETENARITAGEIWALYQADEYPLARRKC